MTERPVNIKMPKRINKEKKRSDIMTAAMHVFSQHGISSARITEIADAAGVGKGTIYEYFRSKEDIFLAAFRYHFEEHNKNLLKILNHTQNPVEKLEILIQHTLPDFLEKNGEFASIMMDFWAEGIRNKDEKILQELNLKKLYSEYRDLIATILVEGIEQNIFRYVDPYSMAAIVIGALDGLMLQWILDHRTLDVRHVSQTLLDLLINGLKK